MMAMAIAMPDDGQTVSYSCPEIGFWGVLATTPG